MKFTLLSIFTAGASLAGALPNADTYPHSQPAVARKGTELQLNGQRWTSQGANVYWLGLDENVIPPKGQPFYPPYNASYPTKGRITEIMNTVRTMGGNVIRGQTLGVSVGNPLSLWPTLTSRNEQAFDTIDWAVAEAGRHGLYLQVPLTDNYNYYHGGKFVFLKWRGININTTGGYSNVDPRVMEFYTNSTIIGDFKNYIHYLLTHKNKYTGLSMAEDPTVAIIETGNELSGPTFGDKYVPNSWTEEIGAYVKSLGPRKLVMDGTYGINTTHFAAHVVDLFSDHFYPLNISRLQQGINQVQTADRVYVAGEYDWTGLHGGDNLTDFYAAIEAHQKQVESVISGDLFWSLFMHNVPNCHQYVNHTDGYTLHYGDPANNAGNTTRIEEIRRHFFRLKGQEVGLGEPPVACPGH